MELLAFSLFDSKATYFNTPFFMPARGQAVRAVIDLANDLNTTVGRHPEDFHLYYLGTFDDQTGTLHTSVPESLGVVASFVDRRPPFEREAV